MLRQNTDWWIVLMRTFYTTWKLEWYAWMYAVPRGLSGIFVKICSQMISVSCLGHNYYLVFLYLWAHNVDWDIHLGSLRKWDYWIEKYIWRMLLREMSKWYLCSLRNSLCLLSLWWWLRWCVVCVDVKLNVINLNFREEVLFGGQAVIGIVKWKGLLNCPFPGGFEENVRSGDLLYKPNKSQTFKTIFTLIL